MPVVLVGCSGFGYPLGLISPVDHGDDFPGNRMGGKQKLYYGTCYGVKQKGLNRYRLSP